jgi:hypothetical protein
VGALDRRRPNGAGSCNYAGEHRAADQVLMIRWIQHVLLAALVAIAPPASADSIANERRLATLEEQHINQENYNRDFDRMSTARIDNIQRLLEERIADLKRDQASQDVKIESLRDTQNIALFLAGITPFVLGTWLGYFYFSKGRADVKRNQAILAIEKRLTAAKL